jgi:predicted amidophosphoribosyltransferase
MMQPTPAEGEACVVCGETVDFIAGLTCTRCGRPFHFASQFGGRDCGIVAPNPASADGC